MCQSKAEGGKRCYPHLSKAYEKARTAVQAMPGDTTPEEAAEVYARYESTVADLSTNDTGRVALRRRATAIESGAVSPEGDQVAVLRRYAPPVEPSPVTRSVAEALATGKPTAEDVRRGTPAPARQVAQTPGPYAASLEEALAYGKPMPPERRVTRTVAPESARTGGGLAAAMRGDTTPVATAPEYVGHTRSTMSESALAQMWARVDAQQPTGTDSPDGEQSPFEGEVTEFPDGWDERGPAALTD